MADRSVPVRQTCSVGDLGLSGRGVQQQAESIVRAGDIFQVAESSDRSAVIVDALVARLGRFNGVVRGAVDDVEEIMEWAALAGSRAPALPAEGQFLIQRLVAARTEVDALERLDGAGAQTEV